MAAGCPHAGAHWGTAGVLLQQAGLNGWLLPAPVAPAEDETGADDAQETDQPE